MDIVVTQYKKKSKEYLAKATGIHVGKDWILRSIKAKTLSNKLIPPVAKLCLLEEES